MGKKTPDINKEYFERALIVLKKGKNMEFTPDSNSLTKKMGKTY